VPEKILTVAAKPRLAIAALQNTQKGLPAAQLDLQHDKNFVRCVSKVSLIPRAASGDLPIAR
jgi:hypothetical protein